METSGYIQIEDFMKAAKGDVCGKKKTEEEVAQEQRRQRR